MDVLLTISSVLLSLTSVTALITYGSAVHTGLRFFPHVVMATFFIFGISLLQYAGVTHAPEELVPFQFFVNLVGISAMVLATKRFRKPEMSDRTRKLRDEEIRDLKETVDELRNKAIERIERIEDRDKEDQ